MCLFHFNNTSDFFALASLALFSFYKDLNIVEAFDPNAMAEAILSKKIFSLSPLARLNPNYGQYRLFGQTQALTSSVDCRQRIIVLNSFLCNVHLIAMRQFIVLTIAL